MKVIKEQSRVDYLDSFLLTRDLLKLWQDFGSPLVAHRTNFTGMSWRSNPS